jgi:prepilin-type N-terminal cleavage/methylation domain-containing protein
MKRPDHAGFTLLEVIVVLVLAALLATSAVISLQSATHAATVTELLERIKNFDRITRSAARSSGRSMQIHFDLSKDQLRRTDVVTMETVGSTLAWTSEVRVEQVVLPQQSRGTPAMELRCSERGMMPTYVVKVSTSAGAEAWLLILGATGQTLESPNEREIREIFAQISNGNDPH